MNQVLNLQIQLLLHQHGRKQVMEALATVENVDLTSIQNQIKSIQDRRKSKTRGPRNVRRESAKALIEAVHLEPEVKSIVREIALTYERKDFLPELRHVRHYLEEAGRDTGKLRFRTDALPEVVAVLASSTRATLEALLASIEDTGGHSDLAILASGILGSVDSTSLRRHADRRSEESTER